MKIPLSQDCSHVPVEEIGQSGRLVLSGYVVCYGLYE